VSIADVYELCQGTNLFQPAGIFRFDSIVDDHGEQSSSSDHPDAVKLLVDYMYNLNFSTSPPDMKDEPEAASTDASDGKQWFKPFEKKSTKKGGQQSSPSALWATQPAITTTPSSKDGPLATHARVFILACKYFVIPLKYQATLKFKACVAKGGLQPVDFAAAMKIAYGTAPSKRDMQMRDCVFECMASRLQEEIKETSFGQMQQLKVLSKAGRV
jgi:hypothetical protein